MGGSLRRMACVAVGSAASASGGLRDRGRTGGGRAQGLPMGGWRTANTCWALQAPVEEGYNTRTRQLSRGEQYPEPTTRRTRMGKLTGGGGDGDGRLLLAGGAGTGPVGAVVVVVPWRGEKGGQIGAQAA